MTDPTPTDDHLDLVSAYLDGEATADERARVEADPALLARVEELRAIAEAVRGGMTPLTDEQAAAQRRRAIAAGQAPAPPARAARGRRRTPLPSPVAAAAVIIVIALLGAWLLVSGGNGSSDKADSASSGAPTATTEPTASDTAGEEKSAAEDARTIGLPSLGSFATRQALTAVLERTDVTTLQERAGAAPSDDRFDAPAASIERCEAPLQAGQPELGDRLSIATARLDGRLVYVFSHPVRGKDAAVTQLSVIDAQTCAVLFAIQR
jgi:hypothetical protein